MKLAEIEALPKDVLTVKDISDYLGSDAQQIRMQAQADPSKLGFPVIFIGHRIKIPKDGFIAFCKGESHDRTDSST